MKKKSSSEHSHRTSSHPENTQRQDANCFSGACDLCGEIYEAESKTEDLEGITFKCRKQICSGRVTLELAPLVKKSSELPIVTSEKSETPRRYC